MVSYQDTCGEYCQIWWPKWAKISSIAIVNKTKNCGKTVGTIFVMFIFSIITTWYTSAQFIYDFLTKKEKCVY